MLNVCTIRCLPYSSVVLFCAVLLVVFLGLTLQTSPKSHLHHSVDKLTYSLFSVFDPVLTNKRHSYIFQEYFASITNTDARADKTVADDIMTFLNKKGRRFSNGDPNKLTLQVNYLIRIEQTLVSRSVRKGY